MTEIANLTYEDILKYDLLNNNLYLNSDYLFNISNQPIEFQLSNKNKKWTAFSYYISNLEGVVQVYIQINIDLSAQSNFIFYRLHNEVENLLKKISLPNELHNLYTKKVYIKHLVDLINALPNICDPKGEICKMNYGDLIADLRIYMNCHKENNKKVKTVLDISVFKLW